MSSVSLPAAQSFDCYDEGLNPNGVHLNDPGTLMDHLHDKLNDLYLYTQHQIVYEPESSPMLYQTRSSPNFEGGVVSYATCKHLMRCTNRGWLGVWIAGLCPAECASNTLLFCGQVCAQFSSNFDLSLYLGAKHRGAFRAKQADNNPRGDLYTPRFPREKMRAPHDHNSYKEPPNHTRSLEYYKKSPGSISERPDGLIPKWWRDIEYISNSGIRPLSFLLSPCWLFSRPMLWTGYKPRRAALSLSGSDFQDSLQDSPPR